jgi:SAM-dependent MidA family methyltransferase
MNMAAEIIRREIENHGILPFARFMELALYCPDGGYYETKINPGRRGDFYTSVSAGELFGHLLAFQFASWLDELKLLPASPVTRHPSLCLIEAGAHDGKLAGDILKWLQLKRPKLFDQIEYGLIEPSARRQEWQRETLKDFLPKVRWFADFHSITASTPHSAIRNPRLNGIIFSNELLDAMPVHRFGWDAKNKKWFEWGVSLAGDKFIWTKIPHSALLTPHSALESPSSIFHLPSSLLDVLPDGYTIEASPAAESWWRNAANILEHGWLLTFDYGLAADEMFSPGRMRGTLRAYFQHHVADDILANPGEQDITAHVNFSAIQKAGEDAGLKTECFLTQSQFLTRILEKAAKDESFGGLVASKRLAASQRSEDGSEDGWSAKQTRQFQTLTHPEHLGRAFRVLVQSR